MFKIIQKESKRFRFGAVRTSYAVYKQDNGWKLFHVQPTLKSALNLIKREGGVCTNYYPELLTYQTLANV